MWPAKSPIRLSAAPFGRRGGALGSPGSHGLFYIAVPALSRRGGIQSFGRIARHYDTFIS